MLLSQIIVRADQYQKRAKPWSETTVNAIVKEGIDLAKFDPIPLIDLGDGVYCVGGDGHSRFRAIQILAEQGRLPAAWSVDGIEWEIPHKLITEDAARKLSRTANLSRDGFTPAEEARVYQEMLDEGMSLEQIALEAHKSVDTVRNTIALNDLCADILIHVGRPTNAGGIPKDVAVELSRNFKAYGVGLNAQQQLWIKILSKMDLTPAAVRSMRGVFSRIGEAERQRPEQGMMFALPPNVDRIIEETKARAAKLARAERALSTLIALADGGDTLDGLPHLKSLLLKQGDSMIGQLKYEQDADGACLGQMLQVA